MSNPILPPPGFMEPIEDRFTLSMIDECVDAVSKWPARHCFGCGLTVSLSPAATLEEPGLCGVCYTPFVLGWDLNLKEIVPMTVGLAYVFKCGCTQMRNGGGLDTVRWTDACQNHRGVVGMMKAGAL